ncbi:GreA/GreB family elongation factor [Microvirga guangxiensis]|uniref:Transcription elongation factor, GreA/GreB family n=1 Tax=Microvirga guangxiensis TaxID=549386 RepID=A0A1G5CY88_9HYPH|nr:GreA/GreB family elongation factor [Microvirga guangxiensis]SCY07218.1 Transcription elongation factor, GreA/GreB family [Microvirga guangxiensis]
MNNATDKLPPITLATNDYNRLMSIAAINRQQRSPRREFLMSELRRASLCHPANLPEDVVSTNAKVTYRLNGTGRPMAQVLVHPEDLNWPGAELSVLTPLGIALLGLRVGDRMPFQTGRDGPVHEVVVEDVQFRLLPDEADAATNATDPSDHGAGNSQDDLERRLDEALMETFPASDPVSVIICGRS